MVFLFFPGGARRDRLGLLALQRSLSCSLAPMPPGQMGICAVTAKEARCQCLSRVVRVVVQDSFLSLYPEAMEVMGTQPWLPGAP